MTPRIEVLAGELEALRSEITELDAVEEPTDEQSVRFAAALTEWDEKEAEHGKLVARAEKVEAVRSASLVSANVERSFSAPNVIIKKDPFENLDRLRFSYDDKSAPAMSDDIVSRAVSAVSDKEYRIRGTRDADIEAVVEKIETIPGVAEHALLHGSKAYRSAFGSWMKSQGQNTVYTPEEADAVRTAMSTSGANGGYTLPTLLDPTLIHTGTASKNPMRQVSRVISGTQNVWHGVSVGNVTSYWTAEATAMTEGSPTFSNPSVTAAKLTAYLTGSFEIFEDSDLQGQLPGLIAESFGYMESDAFVVGSGSGAPKGIITAISATAASTVTATTRGSVGGVDVFNVSNAVPSRYEDTAVWVGNKFQYNGIQQLSTASNGALYWTNLNQSSPPELLGNPIYKASAMAANTTSGSICLILGDFSQFVIYDRIGTSVEFVAQVFNSSALPTGQRGLVAHKRVGSDCTDINAFRFLKA